MKVNNNKTREVSMSDGVGAAARISEGDEVTVNFNGAQTTLCRRARVEYTPCQTGDSWVFTDFDTGETHYVSEGCTITKRPNASGEGRP